MSPIPAIFPVFLSTPSARRATQCKLLPDGWKQHFYPRPPRGGRLANRDVEHGKHNISIHALREEGDTMTLM